MVTPVPSRPTITTPFKKKGSAWATGEHSGVDWASPEGETVVAPWSGTVVGAGSGGGGWGGAYGNAVVIDFDRLPDGSPGLWGILAHLSKVEVRVGQKVHVGQRVGRVGSTGNSTGPHLHFEVQPQRGWVKGSYRDPAKHIAAGGSSSASGGGSSTSAPYVTKDIYSDRLGYGQKDSDTVKELQERLNRIKLVGGVNLPITGNYGDMTDAEVRKWQEQKCGDKPDAPKKSYLGPNQMRKMFGSPPYTIHDKGLPAVARGDGGGGGAAAGGGGGSAAPAPVAWHVPASLVALRDEINARWPNRDKSSDGTIGDYAHSQSKSEHNPVGHRFGPQFGTAGAVHAMDITVAGTDKQVILDSLIGDQRVWYVIHSGFIWSKTYAWEKRAYGGSDPHVKHIHVSLAADDQASALRNEKDIETWLVVEEPPVTVPPGKPDPEITVPPGKPDVGPAGPPGAQECATRADLEDLRQEVFAAFAMAAGSLEGGVAPAPARGRKDRAFRRTMEWAGQYGGVFSLIVFVLLLAGMLLLGSTTQ